MSNQMGITIADIFTSMKNKIKFNDSENTRKVKEEITELQNKLVEKQKILHNLKHTERSRYNEEVSKVNNEFELALYKEYGIENSPARKKIFDRAWEKGHSEGYSRVEQEFAELVELLK